MQALDFTNNSPGALVPTTAGVPAFVPDPAPHGLELEPATVHALAAAERGVGQLTGILETFGRHGLAQLIGAPLLRREAIASCRIEGTVTTPEQLALLEIESEIEPVPSGEASQTQEVLNYIHALEHGVSRLADIPVCLHLICELHEILMHGVHADAAHHPGEFRTIQNFVGGSVDIRAARFVPPPPSDLPQCLHDLEEYLGDTDDELPELVRVALVHYQFEAIHPFRDGNGRVGRLLIPLLLCAYERLDLPVLYVGVQLERHRAQYMDLLQRVSRTGDYQSWVRFLLETVALGTRESIARIEAVLALRDAYHARLQDARSSAVLLDLVDALFARPATSIAAASALLDVTPVWAAANLGKLVDAGILREVEGRRRDPRFVASEIIDVIHG